MADSQADIKRRVVDATSRGDLDEVKRLTIHATKYRWHALAIAARMGHRRIMKYLLPFFGRDKIDLLLLAVCRHSDRRDETADPVGCAELLFQREADPDARDPDGISAMMHACVAGDMNLVRLLRRKNVTMDLFTYAAMGRGDRVRQYLDHSPKAVQAKSDAGWSVLHCAAASRLGEEDEQIADELGEIARLLIQAGADRVSAVKTTVGTQRMYLSPLAMAAASNNLTVADVLIQHGADAAGDWQAFHAALVRKNFDMAVKLHDNGMELDGHGHPFLHSLVSHRHMDAARWLLSRGARVDATDEKGRTALYKLCGRRNADARMAKMLVNFDADPTRTPRGKASPVELAAATGNVKIAAYLRHHAEQAARR